MSDERSKATRVAHAICPLMDHDTSECEHCDPDKREPNGGIRGCIHFAMKAAQAAIAEIEREPDPRPEGTQASSVASPQTGPLPDEPVREGQPMWRTMESAPKDGTEIILACWGATSTGEMFPYWLEESNWGEESWVLTLERMNAHHGSFPATHWMLLGWPGAANVQAPAPPPNGNPNPRERRMEEALRRIATEPVYYICCEHRQPGDSPEDEPQCCGSPESTHEQIARAALSVRAEGETE